MSLIFTNIQHNFRKEHGLSNNEYVLMDMIYHLCNNPKSLHPGWCYSKREVLADDIGISRQGLSKMIVRLEESGFIQVDYETRMLKYRELWMGAIFSKETQTNRGLHDVNLVAENIENNVNLVANDVNLVAESRKLSLHQYNNSYNDINKQRESNASLSSPSSISPSIPLLSEEEKKEMDFLDSPKVEAKKEAVKGGEKILQTLSQAEMIFEKEIEDCQKTYFNSTNYQRAVETLCASSGLSQNKTKESAITDLKYCSVSFNEMLYSTGTTIKTMKDYASHFRNWLQKQDIQEVRERGSRIIHKIPLKENLRNGSNTGISPSVKRQMEAIFGTDPK